MSFAATVLFGTAHSSTTLSKDKFIAVALSGADASGKVKPGDFVALAPVLTNNGDIDTTSIIVVRLPLVNGSPAYDYEINSSWTLIDEDTTIGEFVYGYGTSDALKIVAPGESTDSLCNGFTLKSSITGNQFNSMSSVDIITDGYMVDASEDSEVGIAPQNVWGAIPH